MQANHMIEQRFEFLGEADKYGRLGRLLEAEMDGSRILIFCDTKRGCDQVTLPGPFLPLIIPLPISCDAGHAPPIASNIVYGHDHAV